MYAVDLSVDAQTVATALPAYAHAVVCLPRERDLQISAPKSHITLFTPDSRQNDLKPKFTLNQSQLPLERCPRLIGEELTHSST